MGKKTKNSDNCFYIKRWNVLINRPFEGRDYFNDEYARKKIQLIRYQKYSISLLNLISKIFYSEVCFEMRVYLRFFSLQICMFPLIRYIFLYCIKLITWFISFLRCFPLIKCEKMITYFDHHLYQFIIEWEYFSWKKKPWMNNK